MAMGGLKLAMQEYDSLQPYILRVVSLIHEIKLNGRRGKGKVNWNFGVVFTQKEQYYNS